MTTTSTPAPDDVVAAFVESLMVGERTHPVTAEQAHAVVQAIKTLTAPAPSYDAKLIRQSNFGLRMLTVVNARLRAELLSQVTVARARGGLQ